VRVLVQRVARAAVRVAAPDGGERLAGAIDRGLLLLVGSRTPTPGTSWRGWPTRSSACRVFPDDDGRMNRDVTEAGGAVLAVSQFTLYGDARRGKRPSFVDAARPEVAGPLYDRFVAMLRERGARVETGEFGAAMQVELVNDGPVTLWLER
jgi:D-tyrosyl-tRNA(Tyr) deacylase